VGTPQTLERDLASRIRAAQELSGKKTKALARELGWDISKLRRVKRGDQVPDAIELNLIAAATGRPLDFFFGASSLEGTAADGVATGPHPLVGVKPERGDEVEA
jgi:transcriptional regulator with XRE-family HTH domain